MYVFFCRLWISQALFSLCNLSKVLLVSSCWSFFPPTYHYMRHTHTHTRTHARTHARTNTHTHTHTHTHTSMLTLTPLHVCVCLPIPAHIAVFLHYMLDMHNKDPKKLVSRTTRDRETPANSHVDAYTYILAYVLMHQHYQHAYIRMYVCMYVCMYICVYICTYVCMYVCTYVCTYV